MRCSVGGGGGKCGDVYCVMCGAVAEWCGVCMCGPE